MKQVLQSLNTGETLLENMPCPKNIANTLLIETTKTLVSVGTERMLLEFGKANLLGKIKQQPDKVKMVLEKIKTDGLITTLNAVKAKLDQPIPLGYCHVGRVLEVGKYTAGFSVGDRIVSNGHHAEIVRVPSNMCAKIPDGVSDEEAAFTVVAAIALQGIRLSQPTLGECYVVLGLGLIGLLTVQLLKAQGCRVLGVDFDARKCELAKAFGAEISHPDHIVSHADHFSRGHGVDAVIITAATKSHEPLHQAALISRKRGRIILIGVIGDTFSRADFYEKELRFQVSCSYGPGRYDENYEKKGLDYPIGFVRWTMQRNFEAILDLMAQQLLQIKPLISAEIDIDHAMDAYQLLENDRTVLGILIHYPSDDLYRKTKKSVIVTHSARQSSAVCVGLIGAGNYAATSLAPAFKKARVTLHTVASSQGVSGKRLAQKQGFEYAVTDDEIIFANPAINTVVIATRHDDHAKQVIRALDNNKNIFVEKPLAITLDDLDAIASCYHHHQNSLLMVGFNRRFSPLIQTIQKLLAHEKSPKSFVMTVNAGFIAGTHWVQDVCVGGGRIVGEACHFIDLLRYLSGNTIEKWHAVAIQPDSAMIMLQFSDGSCGAINYLTSGHKALSKEKLDIFCNGKILQLDNFRKLTGLGFKNFKKQTLRRQNKGQVECVSAFVHATLQGKPSPIPFEEIMEVSKISIQIAEYLRQ